MDSRIMEALEKIRNYGASKFNGDYTAAQIAKDALLTAEPEPCEDAEQAERTIVMAITKWRQGCDPNEKEAHNAINAIDRLIDLTKISEKRAKELWEQNEELKALLEEYRKELMSGGQPRSMNDMDIISIRMSLKKIDSEVDNIDHYEWGRLNAIREMAREALAATEPKP